MSPLTFYSCAMASYQRKLSHFSRCPDLQQQAVGSDCPDNNSNVQVAHVRSYHLLLPYGRSIDGRSPSLSQVRRPYINFGRLPSLVCPKEGVKGLAVPGTFISEICRHVGVNRACECSIQAVSIRHAALLQASERTLGQHGKQVAVLNL
jgi:hypothetical protein